MFKSIAMALMCVLFAAAGIYGWWLERSGAPRKDKKNEKDKEEDRSEGE